MQAHQKTPAASLAALLLVLGCAGCAGAPPTPAISPAPGAAVDPRHFEGTNPTFLLWDLRAQRLVAALGEAGAAVRHPACSTFKVPLALMAFDAGLLVDETTSLPWDGVARSLPAWNRDQTAASWMQHSVVWYSQELARRLGKERLQGYLDRFDYGNRDLSAGLTSAWLTVTRAEGDPGRGSLQISPREQLEFQQRLWTGKVPVSSQASERARALMRLETTPSGLVFHGKTGSGYAPDRRGDFGWFVGHLEGNGRELVMVAYFERPAGTADERYPGPLARAGTIAVLKGLGLW